MTIEEANAVNILLKYAVAEYGKEDEPDPWPDDVRQAANLLADEARRVLAGGQQKG